MYIYRYTTHTYTHIHTHTHISCAGWEAMKKAIKPGSCVFAIHLNETMNHVRIM